MSDTENLNNNDSTKLSNGRCRKNTCATQKTSQINNNNITITWNPQTLNHDVCRICLSHGRKLYMMRPETLYMFYNELSKIDNAWQRDLVPQRLCWDCGRQLSSAASFRAKAAHADAVLHEMIQFRFYR